MPSRIIIDRDVEMRTRDGVVLRADVARPDTAGRLPAIAARTTYNKALRSRDALRDPMKVAAAGFAYVIQDTRGRFRSEGDWQGLGWGASEPNDGYDFVEWVASRPWCDGNVGLIGSSYNAGQVIAAASARPPSLKAIAVGFFGDAEALATAGYWLEFVALNLSSPIDALQHRPETVAPEHIETLFKALGTTRDDVLNTLPLQDLPTLQFPGVPRYDEIVRMWREAGCTVWGFEHEIDVPTLNVGGLYDRMSGERPLPDPSRARRKRSHPEPEQAGTRAMGALGDRLAHRGTRLRLCGFVREVGHGGHPPPVLLQTSARRCGSRSLRGTISGPVLRDGRQSLEGSR